MNFVWTSHSPLDLEHVQQLLREFADRDHLHLVVSGCFAGHASIPMLEFVRERRGRAWLVDTFQGTASDPNVQRLSAQHDIKTVLEANLREARMEDIATVVKGDTIAFSETVRDASVDAIYFDSDHTARHVERELAAWHPKVALGGLLFGHDFEKPLSALDPQWVEAHKERDFANNVHPGVIYAVTRMYPNVQQRGRIWFVRKGD